MMIRILSLAAFLGSVSAIAAEGDLTLPGERWYARFERFVCESGAFQPGSARTPATLAAMNVKFERISSDRSLDNVLLLASFEEKGTACRYSAILFADNAKRTAKLVESKAFASSGSVSCAEGKRKLDGYLADMNYLYYGHPHHAALMMPVEDAQSICGGNETAVGADFVVTGLRP
jgi:hypothetical protein